LLGASIHIIIYISIFSTGKKFNCVKAGLYTVYFEEYNFYVYNF